MLVSVSKHMGIIIILWSNSKFILPMKVQVKLKLEGVSLLIVISVKNALQVQCYDQVLS